MEEKYKEITPVVFRIWQDDVIALFPFDKEGYFVQSYMHIGQHSTADYLGIICNSKPCRKGEELPLKKELETIGYNLKVYQRKPNFRMEE